MIPIGNTPPIMRASGVVPGGYDRAASTMALAPLLEQFGVSLDSLLSESGLPIGLFEHPDNLIPFREGTRLMGLCADRTGCPHFGLLMGEATPLEAYGIVADLMKSAADVRAALKLMCRFMTLADGGGLLTLSEINQFASFSYTVYEPGVERADVLGDNALAVSFSVLRTLCGPKWRPHEILFSRSRPADIQPYVDILRAPLRFDVEQSAVVFDRAWLDVELVSADPARLRMLEAKARAMEAGETGNLVAQVRRVVRRQLLSGTCSMQSVAAELGMHRRTLDRRLQAFDLAFKTLSDEVRYDVSRQLLADTAMPVIAIAQSLHYTDPSAFTRAFRRWSGTTPSRWRQSERRSLQSSSA
ncbi:AraC family transcriptional regulator [Dokdonella sp.]|uniref:AraC family transcriptional regulator n=1 Tax=Dokdonella sp. TaxID=2291710 RepID=UPI003C3F53C1